MGERRKLQMLEVRERNGAVCGPEEFAALQAKQQAVLQQLAASRAAAMDLHEQIGTLEQKLAAEEAKNASVRREIARDGEPHAAPRLGGRAEAGDDASRWAADRE